jgi:hypothetical protein
VSGVTVSVRIDSVQAEKTSLQIPSEELFFDVNAKLEEQKKSGDEVDLNFSIAITTKPNVVKYVVAGNVNLLGKQADIKKKLEANPKTNLPQVLFTVYQHVFKSVYIISSVLGAPYPPPDLLHPMAEKILIMQEKPQEAIPQEAPIPQPSVAGATVSTASST